MNTKFFVIEAGPCPECHGQPMGTRQYCAVCDADLKPEDLKLGTHDLMSCGHFNSAWREEDLICPECEGQGSIRREIDLVEALKKLGDLGSVLWDINEWRAQYDAMQRRAVAAEAQVADLGYELNHRSTGNPDTDAIVKQNRRLRQLVRDAADRAYICPWCWHAKGEHTADCPAIEVL